MLTQQWLPSLAGPKPLTPLINRDDNEHAIRWSGDGLRPSSGAVR